MDGNIDRERRACYLVVGEWRHSRCLLDIRGICARKADFMAVAGLGMFVKAHTDGPLADSSS